MTICGFGQRKGIPTEPQVSLLWVWRVPEVRYDLDRSVVVAHFSATIYVSGMLIPYPDST